MKVVLPELPFLNPDKHVMYVQCPHACFPMAGLLNFPLADREDVTGMQTLSCLVHSAVLSVLSVLLDTRMLHLPSLTVILRLISLGVAGMM